MPEASLVHPPLTVVASGRPHTHPTFGHSAPGDQTGTLPTVSYAPAVIRWRNRSSSLGHERSPWPGCSHCYRGCQEELAPTSCQSSPPTLRRTRSRSRCYSPKNSLRWLWPSEQLRRQTKPDTWRRHWSSAHRRPGPKAIARPWRHREMPRPLGSDKHRFQASTLWCRSLRHARSKQLSPIPLASTTWSSSTVTRMSRWYMLPASWAMPRLLLRQAPPSEGSSVNSF